MYLACRSYIDIIYRRSTPSDGLKIVIFPTVTSDTSTAIIDTSDKSPSSCTNTNVTKYQHTDQFYTQPAEIIYISFSIDSTYSAEAVAMGQFNIICHPITRNPTSQPSMTPTNTPTNPSKMPSTSPSIEPTTDPIQEPTIQPTSIPTDIPTLDPTNVPTMTTKPPTFMPTLSPTEFPSRSPVWLYIIVDTN